MSLSPDVIGGGAPSPFTVGRFLALAAGAWGNPSILRQLLGRAFAQVDAARAAAAPPPVLAPAPVITQPPQLELEPVITQPLPPPVVALPPLIGTPPLAPTPASSR